VPSFVSIPTSLAIRIGVPFIGLRSTGQLTASCTFIECGLGSIPYPEWAIAAIGAHRTQHLWSLVCDKLPQARFLIVACINARKEPDAARSSLAKVIAEAALRKRHSRQLREKDRID
jgi:hypothetical protein